MLTQSPSGEPSAQSCTWSMAALAADAADDDPRASMIAAPRCCTVGMNSFSIHAWSTPLDRGLAVDLGVEHVGILRGGVVAPDRHVA